MVISIKETLYESAKDLYELGVMEKEKFERFEAYYLSNNLPYESIGSDEL